MTVLGNQDALTGLLCRSAFEVDKLSPELNSRVAAVIFIDFDHFSRLNREQGRAIGDFMLAMQAERLHNLNHLYPCTTYRYEGDRFLHLVLSEQAIDSDYLLSMAADIRDSINRPVRLKDQMIQVTASQIVAAKPDNLSLTQVLTQAQLLLEECKYSKRDHIRLLRPQYQPEMQVS